jgi:predicted MFS family arabinose efflux permease
VVFGALQAICVAAYAVPALGYQTTPVLYAVCIAEHFAGGMATAALFTLMMDASRERSAGTDYTIQASAVVIATGVASSASGFVAQAVGYAAHFAIGGAVGLVALGFVLVDRLELVSTRERARRRA